MIFGVAVVLTTLGFMMPAEGQYDTPILHQPESGTIITGDSVVLRWYFVDYTRFYQVQIAYDPACTQVILNMPGISSGVNEYEYTGLPQDGTLLYWRVKATYNSSGQPNSRDSNWSEVWAFYSGDPDPTPEPHPADTNADWRLVMDEMVPYIGGWQQGDNPIDYAIRGASIWQSGEYYDYDPHQQCPLCWVLAGKDGIVPASVGDHAVSRVISEGKVTLDIAPAANARVWGVEEHVPEGLAPEAVSGPNNAWNAANRKLSWWGTGDDEATASYTLSGAPGTYPLDGAASVDGMSAAIVGDTAVILHAPDGEYGADDDDAPVSDADEEVADDDDDSPEDGGTGVETDTGDENRDEGEASDAPTRDDGTSETTDNAVTGEVDNETTTESEGCSLLAGKNALKDRLSQWLLLAFACMALFAYEHKR